MIKLIFGLNLSSSSRQRAIFLMNVETSVWLLERLEVKRVSTPANIKLAQAVESLSERPAE